MADPRELLDRLESRHDELIRKLDELNAQIESALSQFGKPRDNPSNAGEGSIPSSDGGSRSARRAA